MTADTVSSGRIALQMGVQLVRTAISQPLRALSKTAQDDGSTSWFAVNEQDEFESVDERTAQGVEVALVARSSASPPAAWQRLLAQLGVKPFLEPQGRTSTGAILFIRVKGRLVAWTFGSGSRWISRRAVDPRFGLLVALNAVAAGGDEGGGLLAAHLAPTEGGLRDADLRMGSATRGPVARFDPMSDRLTGVVVETSMDGLSSVRGARAASFEASVSSLEDLRKKSADLVELRASPDYQEAFSYVENVVEETDPEVVEAVFTVVWQQSDPSGPSLDVAVAWWDDVREEGDDRVVSHFRMPGETRRETVPVPQRSRNLVLNWPGVRAALKRRFPEASPVELMSKELRFYDADDEEVGTCEVRDLVVAEPNVGGIGYVVSEGDVFRVAADYLSALDSFLDGLVVRPSRLSGYTGGHERGYNESTGLALLDRRLVTIDGSRLEPCDLVDDSGRLIFVKRRAKASVMSHLWAQIVASGVLLRRSAAARAAFRGQLSAAGAPSQLLDAIDSGARSLTLVLSILGVTDIRQLTLLARIPLRAAVQRLQDLGYTAEIELVPNLGAPIP